MGTTTTAISEIDSVSGRTIRSRDYPRQSRVGPCNATGAPRPQLVARELSQNARWVTGELGAQPDGSSHVGYVDLVTLTDTDVSAKTLPASTGFSSAAVNDHEPFFIGDTLVFERGDKPVAFDPATGAMTSVPYTGLSLMSISSDERKRLTSISPDRKLIAGSYADVSSTYLVLDTLPPTPPVNSNRLYGNVQVDGKSVICHPVGWLGPSRVLCDRTHGDVAVNDNFYALDVSSRQATVVHCPSSCASGAADYVVWKLSQRPQPVLPANTRTNKEPVPSPDGASLAFLSGQGSQIGLYVEKAAGGEPQLLVQVNDHTHLLGWWSA